MNADLSPEMAAKFAELYSLTQSWKQQDRGRFTEEQYNQLLRPIDPKRVLYTTGQSHVSQQDVRAHLNRIFGFEGWDKEILELRLVRDVVKTVPAKNNTPERQVPGVTYLCILRLTIRDSQGRFVKFSDDVGTGTSPNLPDYGDAHDFASKNAVSYALKRCAIDLGDQYGLSLYNKGQLEPLVRGSLVDPRRNAAPAGDVQAGVPQQVSMGDSEGGEASEGAEPEQVRQQQDQAAEGRSRQIGAVGNANGQPQAQQPRTVDEWRRAVAPLAIAAGFRAPDGKADVSQTAREYARFMGGAKWADAGVEELAAFAAHLETLPQPGSAPVGAAA